MIIHTSDHFEQDVNTSIFFAKTHDEKIKVSIYHNYKYNEICPTSYTNLKFTIDNIGKYSEDLKKFIMKKYKQHVEFNNFK